MTLLPNRATLLALALLPIFATSAALAQDDSGTGEHSGGGPRSRPCRADVQKFCGDVQRGGGRIVACMKSHEAELSPACHDAFVAHEKAHPNAGAAPDARK